MNNLTFTLKLVDQVSGPSAHMTKGLRATQAALKGTGGAGIAAATAMQNVGKNSRQAWFGVGRLGQTAFGAAGSLNLAASSLSQISSLGQRALTAPVEKAVDFERQMSRVRALSQSTAADFQAQTDIARELGRTTIFTASEAAQGLGFLAMAGFNAKKQVQALPAVLDLAAAAGADLGRTAEISSNIMGAFGIRADRMREAADILAATFTNSNTTLESLGETMKYAGPQAHAAGVGLAEVAKFAAVLGNAGIDGSLAGTALRAMLARLAAPTTGARKELNKLGIVAQTASGDLRAPVDVLREMSQAMGKLGSAQKLKAINDIFGRYASSGIAEVIDKLGEGGLQAGIVSFDDLSAAIDKAEGRTAQIRDTMTDNRWGKLKELSSAFEDLQITIGDAFGDTLIEGIRHAQQGIKVAGDWVKTHPGVTAGIMKVVAAGSVLASVLSGIALVASSIAFIGGGIMKVWGGVAATFRGVAKAARPIARLFGGGAQGAAAGAEAGMGGMGVSAATAKAPPRFGGLKGGALGVGLFGAQALAQSETGRARGTWAEGLAWLWNKDAFDEFIARHSRGGGGASSSGSSLTNNTTVNYRPNITTNVEGPMDPKRLAREQERVLRHDAERFTLAGAH